MPPNQSENSKANVLAKRQNVAARCSSGKRSWTIGFQSTPKAAPAALPAVAASDAQSQAITLDKTTHAMPLPQRHRTRLAEALRKQGIDEHRLAQVYAEIMGRLQDKSEDRGVEKLLLDVLKECSRILEEENRLAKPEPRAASTTIVVHNVPRPQRGPQPGGENNGST
jgi:hypothetical protein